jgi:flagellar hook protein FlgE
MSFQQGLSGLNAASKSLEAIGNNVANANTVGFKQSQVQFSDVYASSLTGGGTSAIGIGTKIAQVQQQFTQGNITSSNNPLDIAVNGAGFFRMSTNGTITYTRNGQFQLDKDGFIVNANGSRLTGYMVNDQGQLSTGAATDVVIDSANIEPQLTTEVEAVVNLNSSAPTIAAAFDMDDPTTYTNATSVTVYDSVGNSHVLQTFFVKTGANTFRVYGANDGAPLATPLLGTLTFGSDGQINTALTTLPFSASLTVTGTNAASPLLVDVDFTGSTEYGAPFSVSKMSQDGYTSGRLSGFAIGQDGIITGRYTNGKSSMLGQVVLANFVNANGLQPLGNNQWAETSTSGAALVQPPGSGSLGVLQASAVEDSNVDLTAELVNMITAQRVYQANAQTIKTQDQVLQTLVNLR